jgi:hypothetical protein
MLTQSKIDGVVSKERQGIINRLAYDVVRGSLDYGQVVYKFNHDRTGLDSFIFCGFVKLPKDEGGNYITVLHRNQSSIHQSNMMIDTTFIRDLLFSASTEYEYSAYFLCKEKAERRLKAFRVKQAKDLLIKLEQED